MSELCNDRNCYVHAGLKIRGFKVVGKVISDKGKKTVIVERAISSTMPKYNRILKKTSKLSAHNPPCINAKCGDIVRIGETKKLSKTKAWTVLEVVKGKDAKNA